MNVAERSHLDSDLLRTFLAVARAGNVTRAGEVLGRTQSAISVQIRKLELALSATLFRREARGMTLTEAGRALLPAAEKALGEIERIGALFTTPLTGRVRVGIPDDYGSNVLQRVLASFSLRHPGVEVFVRCGFSTNFPEAIRRDELDFAVCYATDSPEVFGEPLMTERTVWAADAALVLDPAEPVPLALFDRQCWWREAAIEVLERKGRSYRIAYTSESVAGIKAAVSAGLAVGVLAETTTSESMRLLGEKEGFPALPPSSLVLLRRKDAATEMFLAMEAAIRTALLSRA